MLNRGVRIGQRLGVTTGVAQDIEPEAIAISADGNTAWVSLQENNAIAVVDLSGTTPSISTIFSAGVKDWSRGGAKATNSHFNLSYAPGDANPSAGKPEGGISTLDIENSLRFNNSLSLVTVTASKLRDLLEHGVASYPNQGRFPQVSGVAFSFDPTRPAGSRIVNMTIEDATGKDLDLVVRNGTLYGDPYRTFRMVTLNFLAEGGDGYPLPSDASANRVNLFNPSAALTGAATFAGDGTEQDVLAEYLATRHGTLGAAYSIADTAAPLDRRL